MSTSTISTETLDRRRNGLRPRSTERPRLTFGTTMAAEWKKLLTVRSTVFAASALVALAVTLSALVAAFVEKTPAAQHAAVTGNVLLSGVSFSQLVMGVLAVLIVASEYSTGMIQSTLVAVPRRLGVLLAKTLVAVITAIVLTVTAWVVSAAVALPILSSKGVHASLLERDVLSSLLTFVVYMVIVAVFAVFVATIVRNNAGSIAVVVGILFVLPIAATFLPASFPLDDYLLAGAGQTLASGIVDPSIPGDDLTRAGIVVAAWLIALGAGAAVLLQRRDV